MAQMVYLCNHLPTETHRVKGKRTDLSGQRCPIARALGCVGDPWSLLIVRDAARGSRRFGEFQKGLGLAKNILADRLRKLVAIGVLAVQPSSKGGSRNCYVLTEKGERLRLVLRALGEWGESFTVAPDEASHQGVDRSDHETVPPSSPQTGVGSAHGT
jgi:DNA-binding HxlR family transcriptional regulator